MDPVQDNPVNQISGEGTPDNVQTSDYSKIMSEITSSTAEKPETQGNNPAVDEDESRKDVQLPAWTSQLPKELLDNSDLMKEISKFKKIGDLAKGYSDLEGKIGKTIQLPSETSTEDEIKQFYEKLGMPKEAEFYSLPEDDQLNFRQIAFENNLTDAQAKGIYESLKTAGLEAAKASQQASEQLIAETDRGLRNEYGDKYEEKMQLMTRGLSETVGKDVAKILAEAGVLYHPQVARLFIKLGELTAEAGSFSKGNTGGNTGYKATSDGGSFEFKGLS